MPPKPTIQARLRQSMSRLSPRERAHYAVLAVLMIATVGMQLVLVHWYIEDAAISFTYARHLAQGEGLVTYPGGERVEGYSNPTWVLLMAVFQLVGVSGFTSSKIMAAVFGAATVPLVYRITREIRDDATPLVAALALATGAQFVIWNASGLENSLFCFLLALGVDRGLQEAKGARWPWSALIFFALAITRPEGILYAAWAGFWSMCLAIGAGRGFANTWRWLLTFFAPFSAYQALHYAYFAWELPNTYYAKLGEKAWQPFNWNHKGWKYVRGWSHELWQGWMFPVHVAAMVGLRRWRAALFTAVALALAVVLLYPGPESLRGLGWPVLTAPAWWVTLRVWTLLAVAVLLPLATWGRPGARALVVCWGMAFISVFFALLSTGDWMKGYRWFSLLAVPTAVLFAVGLAELADVVRRRFEAPSRRVALTGQVVAALIALGVVLPPNIAHLSWFANKPETGPFSVQKRVNYLLYVQKRLHMLERPVAYDVDMGANMWWSGFEIVDMAGLVDIPLGHHGFDKPFMRQYFFEERRPHFAHVHGGWANTSRLAQHPEWQQYVEIPGYPTGKKSLHIGNHVRKDLIVEPAWSGGTGRSATFADGVRLEGIDMPAPAAREDRLFYVEIGLSTRKRLAHETFRVTLFASDASGQLASWDIPPGYDWYEPHEWEDGDVFHGRFSLQVGALPPGIYDLGVVVTSADGAVLPVEQMPEGAETDGPRFAAGEVRFPGLLRVLSGEEFDPHLLDLRDEALAAATSGDCEAAERGWELTQRAATRREAWVAPHRPTITRALAECWVRAAAPLADVQDQVAPLARAHRWDHWTPSLRAAARPVATTLIARGDAARDAGDWDVAYRAYSDALRVDPTRSFARRKAEEARDQRLASDAERERQDAEARKKRIDAVRARTPGALQRPVVSP